MVRAFEGTLGLKEGELIIPEHHASMGAIGTAILSMEEESSPDPGKLDPFRNSFPTGLEEYIKNHKYKETGLPPLDGSGSRSETRR